MASVHVFLAEVEHGSPQSHPHSLGSYRFKYRRRARWTWASEEEANRIRKEASETTDSTTAGVERFEVALRDLRG